MTNPPPPGPPQGWDPQQGQQNPGQQGPPPGSDPQGQPGYGQPASRSKLPLIIGAAAAAILVIAVVLILVLRGGGSSPEDVTKDFVGALIDKDCDALQDLVTAKLQDQIGSCTDPGIFEGTDASIELGDITVKDETDDSATVDFEITVDDKETTGSLELVKVDGDWKIDAVG